MIHRHTITEEWKIIEEFPMYSISSFGRVFNNRTERYLSISQTQHGHLKVSLCVEGTSQRFTRSVPVLVGEAFVDPPDDLSDYVVLLDGKLDNVAAVNIVWRPRWFEWKYRQQLRTQQPLHYRNLPVRNVRDGIVYPSIVQCGMSEGLLFDDIWRSTYSADHIYPVNCAYEIVEWV